jgi:RNA polymerase sigma-70 factor (ECF subfamily)
MINMRRSVVNTCESKWLVPAIDGDQDAFARLVEQYHRPVYNLCFRMLGTPRDAEDAAQETFLRAYKNIKRYDTKRSFATWLLSIASHYCIDQLRKRRFNTFSIDDDEKSWFEPPDRGIGPEQTMHMMEKQEQVQELLSKLSPKDRAAIILRYWYDYSYEEIASELSLTVSAVKSRLHRSRRDLAGIWTEMQSKMIEENTSERRRHESPAF